MKLKDTNGQYLWVTAGLAHSAASPTSPTRCSAPDLPVRVRAEHVHDRPVRRHRRRLLEVRHRRRLSLQFQRLIELYAATNQVGYIGRLESDGMPLLEEAFARVKLA
jgi:hypothetical protein